MKIEEHMTLMDKLRTLDNEVERLEIIQQLTTDYQEVNSNIEKANNEKNEAVEARDRYRELNNDLWQQVSIKNTDTKNKVEENNSENIIEVSKKRCFEDLETEFVKEYGGNK